MSADLPTVDELPIGVLQPKQGQLLEAMEAGSAPRILYGGARGGGKSHAIRTINLARRWNYPGTTSLVFRSTIPALRDNHIRPMLREMPALYRYWSATDKTLTFPNGSSTVFGSADDERGMQRFVGPEFGDIFIDQGEQISEEWHERLLENNRQTRVPDFTPRYVITANPGGVSHGWLRRVFIDRKRYLPHEDPREFAFIPAFAWDNVEWVTEELRRDRFTVNDYYSWPEQRRFDYFVASRYGRILDKKGKRRRDAMLLGLWDAYEGQFFDCFDAERDPVAFDDELQERLTPYVRRWISMDYGYRHKTAVYWHAQLDETHVVTYREWTVAETSVEEIGRVIGEMTPRGEKIARVYLGGDAWAHRSDEETIERRLRRALAAWDIPGPTRAYDAPGSRKSRASVAYDRLAAHTWLIARTCPALIDLLPDLVSDPDDTDTVLKVEGDDPWDAWSYGVLTPDRTNVVPIGDRLREATAAEIRSGADITDVYQRDLKRQAEARKADRPVSLGRPVRFFRRRM